MAQTEPQFKIRMPEWLRLRLGESAQTNNRSMNAEIVHILTQYYRSIDGNAALDEIREEPASESARWTDSDLQDMLVRALEQLGVKGIPLHPVGAAKPTTKAPRLKRTRKPAE